MSDCPTLVNMALIVELFPSYNNVSVYRWRNTTGKNRLPDPDLVVGTVDLWYLDTILDWTHTVGKRDEVDPQVLARVMGAETV